MSAVPSFRLPFTPFAAIGATLVIGSCDLSEQSRATSTTVRDSAGVRIATNALTDSDLPVAVVGDALVISAGGDLDGGGFESIVAGRFHGSGFVVADARRRQIMFVSPDGTIEQVVGRRGEGPGEFQWIDGLETLTNGGLLVFDPMLGRVTELGARGELVRTASVILPGRPPPSKAWPWGEHLIAQFFSEYSATGTRDRGSATFVVLDWNATVLDTVAVTPGDERVLVAAAGVEQPGVTTFTIPLFAHQAPAAVRAGSLYTARGDEYEIGVFTDAGLDVSLRRPNVRLDFESGEYESAAETILARRIGARPSALQMRNLPPPPPKKPPFGRFVVSHSGDLWVSEFVERDADASVWTMFDSVGLSPVRVELPQGARLLDATDSTVLLRSRDALDLERIEVRRLERLNER